MKEYLLSLGRACALFFSYLFATHLGAAPGPIQTLIDNAAPGSTVFIPAGMHLASLSVSKTLTLQGAGRDATVLDGGSNGRVLTIAPNVKLSLFDVTIQNGSDDDGGGLLNRGNTVLSNVVVRNNNGDRHAAGFFGGGIYNLGTLLVTNSLIASNSALRGGGIYSAEGSSLSVHSSQLVGNTAVEDGGGINNLGKATLSPCNLQENQAYAEGGLGGAIYNGLSIVIRHCTIRENGNYFWGNGGAVWNDGTARLENSLVVSNYALYFAGVQNSGVLMVTNSSILANAAYYDTGGLNNDGDGLVLESHIDDNYGKFGTGVYNGGILRIERTSIDRNYHYPNVSGCRGGGVYNRGILSVYASSICSNSMGDGYAFDCTGAGIFNRAQATLENCTISGNIIRILNSTSFGGGVWNSEGTLLIRSCTITANTAQKGGGISGNGSNVVLHNTILANNFAELGTGPDAYGTLVSSNYNLLGTTQDYLLLNPQGGDRLNVNPQLGSLSWHGGPTITHELLPGSPALDAGDSALSALTDQRGSPRSEDGDNNCTAIPDIGAFEQADPYRPMITSIQRLSPNTLRIRIQAKPNGTCILRSVSDLTTKNWATAATLATDASGICTFDTPHTAPHHFFEVLKNCQ